MNPNRSIARTLVDLLSIRTGVAVLLLALVPAAARAEEGSESRARVDGEAQSRDELEKRVSQLEDEIRKLLDRRGTDRKDAASPPTAGATEVLDDPPIAGSGRGEQFTDPEFLKSVPLFGSNWRFSFGGYAKVDLFHDFSGTGDTQQFTLATIPVNGDPPPGSYYTLQAAETRFNFEVRNVGADVTKNRFFLELDFFDPSLTPRLRHAYFEYGNLLAGRTWTTLTELRMLPFLLDFAAGDSLYGGRTEMIRWQADISDRASWAVALENYDDESVLNVGSASGTARSDLPALVGRLTLEFQQGVVTVGGSLQQNRWDGTDDTPSERAMGWGVMTGGRIYIGSQRRHFFGFGASYSEGAPKNIITFNEAGIPNAVLNADGSLELIPAWNVSVALQVQWSGKWSSNFSFAYAKLDPVPGLPADAMRVGSSTHANLIYSVNQRLRVGVEYMYGIRELVSGDDGTASRLQFSIIFSF